MHWWAIIWKLNKAICGNPCKFSSQTPNLTGERNIHPSHSYPDTQDKLERIISGLYTKFWDNLEVYPKVSHVINILDESLPTLSQTVHFCCQVNAPRWYHYWVPVLTRHQVTHISARIHQLETGWAREGSAFEIKGSCLQPSMFLVVVGEGGQHPLGRCFTKWGWYFLPHRLNLCKDG